jgi:hypothetical protein
MNGLLAWIADRFREFDRYDALTLCYTAVLVVVLCYFTARAIT